MATQWTIREAPQDEWKIRDEDPLSPPLPDLPRPSVSVEPQGSWLVRGAAKIANPPMAAAGPAALPVDAAKPREWERDPEYLDKPLLSLPEPAPAGPDAGTAEKVVRGLGQSASRNIAALSTPRNVGVMGGLAAANLAGIAFPPIQPAVQAANASAATYFANDMIGALPQQTKEYWDATDAEAKARILGDIAATSTMAAGITRGGVEAARPTAQRMAGVGMTPDATASPQSTLRSVLERDKAEKAAKAQAEAEAAAQQQAAKEQAAAQKQVAKEQADAAKAETERLRQEKIKAELGEVTLEAITEATAAKEPSAKPSGRTNLAEDPVLAPEYLDQKPNTSMGDVVARTEKLAAADKLTPRAVPAAPALEPLAPVSTAPKPVAPRPLPPMVKAKTATAPATEPTVQRVPLAELETKLSQAVIEANRENAMDVAYPKAEDSPHVNHIKTMIEREKLRQSDYLSDVVTPVFERGEKFYQDKLAEYEAQGWSAPEPVAPQVLTPEAAALPPVEQPGVFYRGANPGDTRRIDEPFSAAKGKTFAARKESSAKYYGSSIERIEAKPNARILYEGTSEFGKLWGKRGYDKDLDFSNQTKKGQTQIDFVNEMVQKAEAAGYDAISFKRDTDIGSVILNEAAFQRGVTAAPAVPMSPARASRRKTQGGALNVPNPFKEAEVLTPEQQWAAEYAKVKIAEREATRGGIAKRGVEAFKETVGKLKSEAIDSLSPILDAVADAQKKYNFDIRPASRFEYYADRALGSREMAERFMRDDGLLDVIRAPETRAHLDRFDQYVIAKEAIREAQSQKRETGRHYESDQRYVEAWKDAVVDKQSGLTYDQLSEKFYAYGNSLLKYSVDSGLISKDMAQSWREQYGGKHAPLARVFDAIEKANPGARSITRQVANLAKQTVFNKREGSLRPIDNPMFEMMERTRAAFAQGERNKAAQALAGYRELPGMKNLMRDATGDKTVPKHSFNFLEDGKRQVIETTPEIAAAAKTLDAQNLGVAGKIVGYPARMARFFTTGVRPSFALANVPVDLQTTGVVSRNTAQTTMNPVVFTKALLSALKHDETWSKIESHGAGFTQLDLYRNTREHTIDAIRAGKNAKERGRYIASHPLRTAVEVFRFAEDVVSRSEQTGRARVFLGTEKASVAQGYTPKDAEILGAIASNNELPNYRRSGNVTRALNGAILYLNAGIQGSRILARAMKDRPIETSAKIAVGLYMPVTLATLYNLSDPDRKNIYDDIRQYEKDNNLIVVLPGAKLNAKTNKYEGILKVKLAPGLSNLTVPVRRMIEKMHGADPMTFQEIAQKMVGTVSPVEPSLSGIGAGLTPQIAKPGLQALTNYDLFRGGPKLPRRLQSLPKQQQVMPNTSGTLRRVANSIGTSPVMTEEFFKDTIGGAAPEVINAVDSVAAKMGLIPQDEIGGQSVGASVTARFEEARAGESDQKVYDALDKVKDKAMNRGIEILRADPRYQAIQDKEQRLALERKAASSVAAKVSSMSTSHKEWDTATYEQKMSQLRYIDAQVGGKPALRPLTPPTR